MTPFSMALRLLLASLMAVTPPAENPGKRPALNPVQRLLAYPPQMDIASIPPSERPQIERELWCRAKGLDPVTGLEVTAGDTRCLLLLLKMGYRPAVADFESTFRKTPGGYQHLGPYPSYVVSTAQPRLIPVLMERLDNDEDLIHSREFKDGYLTGKEAVYPPSLYGPSMALGIIPESSAFGRDAQTWARMIRSELESQPIVAREAIRAWWKENQEAILAERYLEVKEGPNLPRDEAALLQAFNDRLAAREALAHPPFPKTGIYVGVSLAAILAGLVIVRSRSKSAC